MFKCDFFSLLRLVKSWNNNPFFVICGFLWSPHIQRKPFRQKIINDQTINNFSPFCIFFFVCVSKRNQWKGSVLIKHWLSTYIHRILLRTAGPVWHAMPPAPAISVLLLPPPLYCCRCHRICFNRIYDMCVCVYVQSASDKWWCEYKHSGIITSVCWTNRSFSLCLHSTEWVAWNLPYESV